MMTFRNLTRYRFLTYLALQCWWLAGVMVVPFIVFPFAMAGLSDLGNWLFAIVTVPFALALGGHFAWSARGHVSAQQIAQAAVNSPSGLLQKAATPWYLPTAAQVGKEVTSFSLIVLVMIMLVSAVSLDNSVVSYVATVLGGAVFLVGLPWFKSGALEQKAIREALASDPAQISAPLAQAQHPTSNVPNTHSQEFMAQVTPVSQSRRQFITYLSLQCWWILGLLFFGPPLPERPWSGSTDISLFLLSVVVLAVAGYILWGKRGNALGVMPPAADKNGEGLMDQWGLFKSGGRWRFIFAAALAAVLPLLPYAYGGNGVAGIVIALMVLALPPWLLSRKWP